MDYDENAFIWDLESYERQDWESRLDFIKRRAKLKWSRFKDRTDPFDIIMLFIIISYICFGAYLIFWVA